MAVIFVSVMTISQYLAVVKASSTLFVSFMNMTVALLSTYA
jgi:hypothetical protein